MSGKYKLSLTAAGLLPLELRRVASVVLQCKGDWSAVYDRMCGENLLQARTVNSLKRIGRELINRLKLLSMEELRFLAGAEYGDLNALAWVAACRNYPFVADFAIEVLRDAYVMGRKEIAEEDIDHFIQRQMGLHAELDRVSELTRAKIRQVTFRMAIEAGYLNRKHTVIPAVLSPALIDLLPEEDYLFFPMYVPKGAN